MRAGFLVDLRVLEAVLGAALAAPVSEPASEGAAEGTADVVRLVVAETERLLLFDGMGFFGRA